MDSGGRKVKEPPPFVRTAPAAPEWLDDEARAEWERVVPEMDRLKMLKGSSFSSLVAYCECWSRYLGASRELRAHVEETGRMTYEARQGVIAHPAVSMCVFQRRLSFCRDS